MSRFDVVLAIFVALVWGFAFVVIKVGVDNFPPLLFSAMRFTFVAFPLVFFLPAPKTPWQIIVAIGFALGVIKFSLLFVSIDVGLAPGLASLLIQLQAFFTVIFAAVLLKEKPTRRQITGIIIAFCGITLVMTTIDSSTTLLGVVLITIAAVAWAVANILLRYAGPVQMLNLIVWASLVPPLPVLGLSLWLEGPAVGWQALTTMTWQGGLALLYVILVGTLLGFVGWGRLINRYGPSRIAPFALLVPIFGMASSALFLGETFRPTRLLGALLVLIGLYYTIDRTVI